MQDVEKNAEPAASGDSGTGSLAALAALALSACGGGEDGSAGSHNRNRGEPPTPIPSPPPPGPLPLPPRDGIPATDAEAARFLLQAQFAVSDADISALKAGGYLAWLDARYAEPLGESGVAWLDARGRNVITEERRYLARPPCDHMMWNQLIAGPDQMRKRVALALSELFVISLGAIETFHPAYVTAGYWGVLTENAFGNFRHLIEKITLNAAMGYFLNTRGNLKEDSLGRQPDENFAREVMQLFTIGLYELNIDGTPRLDANDEPMETFDQEDVSNLARVFTGYNWDYESNGGYFTSVEWATTDVPSTHFASNPMNFRSNRHSTQAVNFLGTRISGTTPGADALHIALDRLFYHDNTGPFFARQMIQRLVTSNPSPAYVQRVATVFGNNGFGVRGDLKAVWTAILTDEEARAMPADADTLGGKLREPMLRFIQWARTAEVASDSGAYEIDDLSDSDRYLGQSPLRAPSVFNFFRPGYVPPNTEIAAAGKQAPEFQLLNESSMAGYINFMQRVTRNGVRDVTPRYTTLLGIAHDVPAVVDWLNLRLTANQLSRSTLDVITSVLRGYGVTTESPDGAKADMLSTGCFLVLISPEYLVQK